MTLLLNGGNDSLPQMTGTRYHRFTLLSERGVMWLLRCDCGTTKELRRKDVLNEKKPIKSCGCLKRDRFAEMGRAKRTHGMHKTPTWRSWSMARNRCRNPNATGYERYGGRGISFDPRWDDFAAFLSDMGVRPDGLTLERVDNAGNYEPGNCIWATPTAQARNRRSNRIVDGRTLAEVSTETGIGFSTIIWRLEHGWDEAEAISRRPGS